jgi:hypothetical protein
MAAFCVAYLGANDSRKKQKTKSGTKQKKTGWHLRKCLRREQLYKCFGKLTSLYNEERRLGVQRGSDTLVVPLITSNDGLSVAIILLNIAPNLQIGLTHPLFEGSSLGLWFQHVSVACYINKIVCFFL